MLGLAVHDSTTQADAEPLRASRLSVALPCVLMLTTSKSFNLNVQGLVPVELDWFEEHPLHEIRLSSLLLIVLLRSVFGSLHGHNGHAGSTVCTSLAAIANMSAHIKAGQSH